MFLICRGYNQPLSSQRWLCFHNFYMAFLFLVVSTETKRMSFGRNSKPWWYCQACEFSLHVPSPICQWVKAHDPMCNFYSETLWGKSKNTVEKWKRNQLFIFCNLRSPEMWNSMKIRKWALRRGISPAYYLWNPKGKIKVLCKAGATENWEDKHREQKEKLLE